MDYTNRITIDVKKDHFNVLSTVTALAHPFGTVYARLAPDSYVTEPLLSTFMNLYSKLVPAGSLIVVVQSGLEDVYWLAESAGADPVSQLPSCEMDPAIFTVCPKDVVVLELKVTATVATGVAQPLATAVDVLVVAVDVGFVDGEGALLDVGGVEPPDPVPVIWISAHVK